MYFDAYVTFRDGYTINATDLYSLINNDYFVSIMFASNGSDFFPIGLYGSGAVYGYLNGELVIVDNVACGSMSGVAYNED